MANSDAFTIEESHDKPRLTAPRLSNLGTVPTEDQRSKNHGEHGRFKPGNQASANRSAKRALVAPLRAARKRFQDATEGQPPTEADGLLNAALAVYHSGKLELGSKSVFVLSHVATFAIEHVLAGHYVNRAAEVGFDAGAEFLAMAQRCEQASQRAMTAALAAAKALPGLRPADTTPDPWFVSEPNPKDPA